MPSVLIKFVVPGKLRGKGRHHSRVVTPKDRKAFVQSFPDKRTVEGEALVREIAAEAMAGRPPFFGPLIMKIMISINRTQSWSAAKKKAMQFVTGFPDLDNIGKLVGDAIQGIAFQNDNQLCELHVRRVYDDSKGEEATIWIMAPDGAASQDQPKPPSNGAALNLVLPLPPAPPKPAAEPRKPASFKIGDRVHSIAVGTKAEFEGVVIETDGKNYVVEEGLLGKPWMRAHSELFPAKGD